jgi:diguanylate cyclase (GGDEF)-like protein
MPTRRILAQHTTTYDPTSSPLTILPGQILLADDDPEIRRLLEELLSDEGYAVNSAATGNELVHMAQQIVPDLILADLKMPMMNGDEAVRLLRRDPRTAHIPMLLLTAQANASDVVDGFASGADDYITKPFDTSVLLARIRSHMRRAGQTPVYNPLTGLPGNTLLLEEIRYRLEHHVPLALLYVDLDNFKVFNDCYGFARGDEVLLLVAHLIQQAVESHGDAATFIGHIGGDDFAILAGPEQADGLCQALVLAFDRAIEQFYDPMDRERGYLSGVDRHGMLRRFALMNLSIGVATTHQRIFAGVTELTRVAADLKQYAKTQPGSSYAMDRRRTEPRIQVDPAENRRRRVLVLSEDEGLRSVIRAALMAGGLGVDEATSVDTLAAVAASDRLIVVLTEARLGPALWAYCRAHAGEQGFPPLVILAATDAEEAQARDANTAAILRQPLPVTEVVACIREVAARHRRDDEESEL